MCRIKSILAALAVAFLADIAVASQASQSEDVNARILQLYKDGKYNEAVTLAEAFAAKTKRRFGANHPQYAAALYNLATLYVAQGRYKEAERFHKRGLAIRQKALGPQDITAGDSLKALAIVYHAARRYSEAESFYKQSLDIGEKARGADDPDIGDTLNRLGALYHALGRFAEAEPLYQRSLTIQERARRGSDAGLLDTMGRLAELYRSSGRFAEAEPLYKRSLLINEAVSGPDNPALIPILSCLNEIYRAQARYAEAEPLAKRMLAISEKAYGPDHARVAVALNNLAALYHRQGRLDEAEPLYRRALAIGEKALGPEHLEVENTLTNLAALYDVLGRPADAEPLFKRAFAMAEKRGANHKTMAIMLNNIAAFYYAQQRFAEAEPYYKQAIEVTKTVFGPRHTQVASALSNLAALYYAQSRFDEAEPLLMEALSINSSALSPDHIELGRVLNNLAGLFFARGEWARAAAYWERSTEVLEKRTLRDANLLAGPRKSDAEQADFQFRGLVRAAHRLAPQRDAEALASQMFEKAQWALGSQAAASIAKMAARGAKGDPALAALVRQRQDLVAEWQKLDGLRNASLSKAPQERDAASDTANAARLAGIDAAIRDIDKKISIEFPDYFAFASPAPAPLKLIQAQLRSDEALILFLDTPDWWPGPVPEETFVWVVTQSAVRWYRSALGSASLAKEVAALRCGLDVAAWDGDGGGKCAKLLNLAQNQAPRTGGPLPFDLARAHTLYKALFGEAEEIIVHKSLFIVPSGALTQLPFQVLVTQAGAPADYKSAAWLVNDHAIAVLPAVSSLVALRRAAHPSAGQKPLIGFGNPLLEGPDGRYADLAKRARESQSCASAQTLLQRGELPRRGAGAIAVRGGLTDVSLIRAQVPLPETADEMCAVARDLNADPGEIRLGLRATEAELKSLSSMGALAQYRILHFATHGALAGQVSTTAEPGLLLTPPEIATEEDDGYLSASEVAALKLDADWVILSACNTAGAETVGGEALSGLARAFFYAQARALLVSHWEVDSAATVKLITGAMKRLASDQAIGRAEAMRQAMSEMIENGEPYEAHPAYWAPFVVVGEGGSAK